MIEIYDKIFVRKVGIDQEGSWYIGEENIYQEEKISDEMIQR